MAAGADSNDDLSGSEQNQGESQSDDEHEAVEGLEKKMNQDLKQGIYTTLMKEMAMDSASNTISFENLSLLLFMTQKAISDLKLLKSLFFHRRQHYGLFPPGKSPWN